MDCSTPTWCSPRGRFADGSGDGGFHWQTVGLGTAGKTAANDILNTSGGNGIGECGQSTANEQACSLDAASASGLNAGTGAENPTVTAGTMVAGKATTPWIAWDESTANGGLHSVFVARLDAAGDHFDLLNNGQPISHSGLDSTRPDIVFSHNTPYVSWHEKAADGTTTTFVGHFEGNPANPVFKIDTGAIPTTTPLASDDGITDVRQPVGVDVPGRSVHPGRRRMPGKRGRHAVLRVHEHDERSTGAVRADLSARERADRCGERGRSRPGDAWRVGEPRRRPGAGPGRVRPDDQLRAEHGGSVPGPVGDPDAVQRGGDRPARGNAALSRGRDQRLRDLRRPRRDRADPGYTAFRRRLATATRRSATPRSRARPRASGCPAREPQERPASSRSG